MRKKIIKGKRLLTIFYFIFKFNKRRMMITMKYYDPFSRQVAKLIKPMWQQIETTSEEDFDQFKSQLIKEVPQAFMTPRIIDFNRERELTEMQPTEPEDVVDPDLPVLDDIEGAAKDIIKDRLQSFLKEDHALDILKNHNRIAKRSWEAHQKWQEEKIKLEENPESAEWDYGAIVLPEEPTIIEEWSMEDCKNYIDSLSLQDLIHRCRGDEGLDWLLFDVLEYTLEITDTLVRNIDYTKFNLSQTLVQHFLYHLDPIFKVDEIMQQGFACNSFIQAISDISYDNFHSILKVGQFRDAIDQVIDGAIVHEQLKSIRDQFIVSANKNDLLSQQRLWLQAVFPLQQIFFALPSGELTPKAYKRVKEKLEKTRRIQSLFFKVMPTLSTTKIVYPTKRIIGNSKHASFDFFPWLETCRERGRKANTIFVEEKQKLDSTLDPKKEKTNMIVPMMYFVVTTKPHQKNGDHQRIFVPVELYFPNLNAVVARDVTDQVVKESQTDPRNLNANEPCYATESHDDSVFKQLFPDYSDDNTIQKMDSRSISFRIHHSERLLYRLLKDAFYVEQIITQLKETFQEKMAFDQLNPIEKFKVYACGLLLYSTHATCEDCARPTVLAQYFLEDRIDILSTFLTALNQPNAPFMATQKLRFNTVVLADKPFGKIDDLQLENAIRLDIPEKRIDIKNNKGLFFEFIEPEKITPPEKALDRAVDSTVFMSGFKGRFFRSESQLYNLNRRFNEELEGKKNANMN